MLERAGVCDAPKTTTSTAATAARLIHTSHPFHCSLPHPLIEARASNTGILQQGLAGYHVRAREALTMTDTSNSSRNTEVATLGGGCFWCLEPVFDDLKGVTSVESGYAGGSVPAPTYEQVCTGRTGHAEVVRVTFDPSQISYRDILHVFFAIHDPTTLNRQGNDVGPQYRSVIFYHSPEQERTAQEVMHSLNEEHVWSSPIVTQLVPFTDFYQAEDYHQEYFANNPGQPYCNIVIAPKVAKFRQKHLEMLKA